MIDDREPIWDAVDLLLFLGLGLPIFLVLSFGVAAALKMAHLNVAGVRLLLAQFAGYVGALIPLFVIFRGKYGESPMHALRMGVSAKDAATSVSLGIVTAFAVTALALLLRTPTLKMPMEQILEDWPSLVAAAILGVTLGPWFEELIFRGLVQPLVGRYAGAVSGIAFSALTFALLHGPQYAWSWRHVLLISLAGAAFGLRRYVTNSTGAAAVMHAAYNLVLFAAFIAGRWSGAQVPRTV